MKWCNVSSPDLIKWTWLQVPSWHNSCLVGHIRGRYGEKAESVVEHFFEKVEDKALKHLCWTWCNMWANKTLWLLMVFPPSCLDHRWRLVLAHWSMKQRPRARNERRKSRKQSKRCSCEGSFCYPKTSKREPCLLEREREQREVLWDKAFLQAWPMASL